MFFVGVIFKKRVNNYVNMSVCRRRRREQCATRSKPQVNSRTQELH